MDKPGRPLSIGFYYKTALRSLLKDRGFSALNIAGLAAALAVCLLIGLFVTDEWGFDRYNTRADRIFRLHSDIHLNGNGMNYVAVPSPMGPALIKDYPAIENAVRIRPIAGGLPVKLGNERVLEPNAVFADPSLFDVFTLPFAAGNPQTALADPYSMVISARIAEKYFHGSDAIGKTLTTDDTTIYKITGVMKDMPLSSHFHFDFIKSMAEKSFAGNQLWINLFAATYVLAKPGTTTADIDKMLSETVTRYIGPQLEEQLHSSLPEMAKNGDYFRFHAMRLADIHLHSDLQGEFEPNGNLQRIYVFIAIALLILLIACTNFMNISTARSADRSREVGVRKVLGASRNQLIRQFITESIMTSFAAGLLALGIAALLLPYFNRLTGKNLSWIAPRSSFELALFGSKSLGFCLVGAPVIVGLIAGSYPAFFLSRFKPVRVLKGSHTGGFKNTPLRNTLVVFQFVVAISLIIATGVILRQLDFIRHRDQGYNRDQVLTIANTRQLGAKAAIFKEEVQKLPGITGSTMTGFLPDKVYGALRGYFKETTARASQTLLLGSWTIDADYIPLLKMSIVNGRNFSPLMPTDSSSVLINETAARLLGYPDPVNKFIYTGPDPITPFRILGVVKDFNAGTPRDKIEPIVFHLGADNSTVSFRIGSATAGRLIPRIKEIYGSMGGSEALPFTWSFMDEDFNKLYQADERAGRIVTAFAVFAIFIAAVGLFGLVTYAAMQRTREIGIRKTLGATVGSIVSLLTKDFLRLVGLAALIACPLSWWIMHRWLQDFAYRTSLSWWIFAASGSLALLLTIATVSFRAIKAALANPVKSLRTE